MSLLFLRVAASAPPTVVGCESDLKNFAIRIPQFLRKL